MSFTTKCKTCGDTNTTLEPPASDMKPCSNCGFPISESQEQRNAERMHGYFKDEEEFEMTIRQQLFRDLHEVETRVHPKNGPLHTLVNVVRTLMNEIYLNNEVVKVPQMAVELEEVKALFLKSSERIKKLESSISLAMLQLNKGENERAFNILSEHIECRCGSRQFARRQGMLTCVHCWGDF